MKNLELNYEIKRKDLETNDQNIVQIYSKILKKHKKLDIRFNRNNSTLLSINKKTIKKIFEFLENEIPEEHILFLFEKKDYKKNKKEKKNNESIINTSTSTNSNTNINKIIEEVNDENEEKRQFLTLEVENPENPVLKKFKTLTQKVMKKYYFIFCVLCLIIAILFTIHLFMYLLSKEVTINIIYNNLYSLNFVNIYWHADC